MALAECPAAPEAVDERDGRPREEPAAYGKLPAAALVAAAYCKGCGLPSVFCRPTTRGCL